MAASAEAIGSAVIRGLARSARIDAGLKPLATTHGSVKRVVDKVLPGRELYAFGSITVYGFMEAGSDVDFVVLDPRSIRDGKGLDDASQRARAVQAHAISQISRGVRQAHRAIKMDEVKRTRVPVLRCSTAQPPAFPVPFDITVDRRNGVRNSWLLRSYFDQYPQARWLAMAVKRWSKDTQMNGSMGFLTSYAFNIMVVHYYTQLGKMQFVPLESADVSVVSKVPTGMPLAKPKDLAGFGNEVHGFFDYYLDNFDYNADVVSLSRAGRTTTNSIGWTREAEDALTMKASDGESLGKVFYRFCIEDPFEVNLNVGRNVSAFKLDIMKQHLSTARMSAMGWLNKADDE